MEWGALFSGPKCQTSQSHFETQAASDHIWILVGVQTMQQATCLEVISATSVRQPPPSDNSIW